MGYHYGVGHIALAFLLGLSRAAAGSEGYYENLVFRAPNIIKIMAFDRVDDERSEEEIRLEYRKQIEDMATSIKEESQSKPDSHSRETFFRILAGANLRGPSDPMRLELVRLEHQVSSSGTGHKGALIEFFGETFQEGLLRDGQAILEKNGGTFHSTLQKIRRKEDLEFAGVMVGGLVGWPVLLAGSVPLALGLVAQKALSEKESSPDYGMSDFTNHEVYLDSTSPLSEAFTKSVPMRTNVCHTEKKTCTERCSREQGDYNYSWDCSAWGERNYDCSSTSCKLEYRYSVPLEIHLEAKDRPLYNQGELSKIGLSISGRADNQTVTIAVLDMISPFSFRVTPSAGDVDPKTGEIHLSESQVGWGPIKLSLDSFKRKAQSPGFFEIIEAQFSEDRRELLVEIKDYVPCSDLHKKFFIDLKVFRNNAFDGFVIKNYEVRMKNVDLRDGYFSLQLPHPKGKTFKPEEKYQLRVSILNPGHIQASKQKWISLP